MIAPPNILLLDDDPAVRESLKFSLELEGFEVATFGTAEELAEDERVAETACLVLDYRLPGMNGLALLGLLRRRGIAIPAIIVTSTPTRAVRALAADQGALLIEKPLLCGALTAAIRSLVERPAQAA